MDQSAKYLPLLESITNDKIKLYTLYEDYHFSFNDDDFQTLPDKYLFYDENILDIFFILNFLLFMQCTSANF